MSTPKITYGAGIDPFPFDDLERLEREEDELPLIPEWPTIFANNVETTPNSD